MKLTAHQARARRRRCGWLYCGLSADVDGTGPRPIFAHGAKASDKVMPTCHMMPTSNWVAARGFPDVANFPVTRRVSHCHKSNVLVGSKPTFCLGCHSNVAPGSRAVSGISGRDTAAEFTIKFPHNVHQDILARRPAAGRRRRRSLRECELQRPGRENRPHSTVPPCVTSKATSCQRSMCRRSRTS